MSEINSDITLSLFIGNQFIMDNAGKIELNQNILIGDLYKENIHSKSFNVKAENISNLLSDYLLFIAKSSYITVYTSFEAFIRLTIEFVENIMGIPFSGKYHPKDIFIIAGSDIDIHLSDKERDTLFYIRKRRNKYIHADYKTGGNLIKTIREKGDDINRYWISKGINLNRIDFKNELIDEIDCREVIDIINILRNLASRIDHETLTLIGKERIINYALYDFKMDFAKEIKQKQLSRVENMFLSVLKRKFNLDKEDVDLSSIVFK
jgi:hypothetical protein